MPTITDRILALLQTAPGQSDREITERLFYGGAGFQPVNQACRVLERKGFMVRQQRPDSRIGNYLAHSVPRPVPLAPVAPDDAFSAQALKRALKKYLEAQS